LKYYIYSYKIIGGKALELQQKHSVEIFPVDVKYSMYSVRLDETNLHKSIKVLQKDTISHLNN